LSHSWGPRPQFKIVADVAGAATTYENEEAFSIVTVHPENNIASAVIQISDYKNKNYESVFSSFDVVDIYLRVGSDDWTKVLRGHVSNMAPSISPAGEILEIGLWCGAGQGLMRTHCNTSYGTESQNPTLNTPKEVIQDIVNNYVEKQFGGASSNWVMHDSKIEDVLSACSLTYLDTRYLDNFTLINRVCDIATAYAVEVPDVGPHWRVDTGYNLYVKQIDDDSSDSAWMEYWKDTQAASTLTVSKDMVLYNFQKHMAEYANHILLFTNVRKPGYDTWTEGQATDTYWGETNINVTSEGAIVMVGSAAMKGEGNAAALGYAWYPVASDASWDLEKCSSENTIPTVNFYCYEERDLGVNFTIRLRTNVGDYFEAQLGGAGGILNQVQDEWIHVKLPVGPYYALSDEARRFRWSETGSPDWGDIDDICFQEAGTGVGGWFLIDDLHFSGKIIREAKDTSEITTYKDHQWPILNNTAVDDTLQAGTPGTTDIGTAARLAKAEMLRRATIPVTAMLKIPLAVDFLPGQKTHCHANEKADGTFRTDVDFRAVEVKHTFNRAGGFTILNLTDDVTNSHAKALPTQASLLAEYVGALGHKEAKNLKGSGMDPLLTRLTESY
jgi:hypothetical protein